MSTKINIESAPVRALRNGKPCVVWINFALDPVDIQTEERMKEFVEKTGERIKVALYNHITGRKP